MERAVDPSQNPATDLPREAQAQLSHWQALSGRWQGTPEQTDALVEDIYADRTEGREVAF